MLHPEGTLQLIHMVWLASTAQVVVRSVHWAPAARLLALVLEDGRCALCRTPEAGMQPVEQVGTLGLNSHYRWLVAVSCLTHWFGACFLEHML